MHRLIIVHPRMLSLRGQVQQALNKRQASVTLVANVCIDGPLVERSKILKALTCQSRVCCCSDDRQGSSLLGL